MDQIINRLMERKEEVSYKNTLRMINNKDNKDI